MRALLALALLVTAGCAQPPPYDWTTPPAVRDRIKAACAKDTVRYERQVAQAQGHIRELWIEALAQQREECAALIAYVTSRTR